MRYELRDLIIAVRHNCDLELIKEILDSGFDVNQTTEPGCTPLMFAVMPNDYGDDNAVGVIKKVVELLLEYGAQLDLKDTFNMTAYDYAKQLVDPNFKNNLGESSFSKWKPESFEVLDKIIELVKFE